MKHSIGRWALALILPATVGLHADVVINEIHYAPQQRTSPEEFVEIYNNGSTSVDLSGWYFSDGIDFVFDDGTSLATGAYLTIAEDPDHLRNRFGNVVTVGPFSGRLSNQGETLILRNSAGGREDEVQYNNRFPWPIVGSSSRPNNSIELLNPDMDNDLGGSWRPSDPGLDSSNSILGSGGLWKFRKGTSPPSNPATAWRAANYNDDAWQTARTSIGYGDGDDAMTLDDMRNGYSSLYLRREFNLESLPPSLRLRLYVDDGAVVWINGIEVLRSNVGAGELDFDDTAGNHEAEWEEFSLPAPAGYLEVGRNVIAVHALNATLNSSDFSIDVELVESSSGSGPSPGAINNVFSTNTGPLLRQATHSPNQPVQGQIVIVSIKATDPEGIDSVMLEYQVVEPGSYIRISDPEYTTEWTSLLMSDSGSAGDLAAHDNIYSAAIPTSAQQHRNLVRYRFVVSDLSGRSVSAPYPEDPQPNFAYFVYNAIPSWTGSARPGVSNPVEYGSDLLASIPVYQFIARRQDRLNAQYVPYRSGASGQMTPTSGSYGGSDYRWQGTMVYDGEVYDHIRFRARGGVWRYAMGKNMWKFDFNRGHYFKARDDYGRRYDTTWDKVNFSALIQQGNFGQRGEQGLFEGAGFRLHNLSGNAAPKTHYVHFRLVEAAAEEGPDQFSGDFQGLYMVIEQMDGRFLDEHRLPDGNLYKMEGGSGDLNNQGPAQPTNKSDLNAFLNGYRNGNPGVTWWRENLDLPDYYSFRSMAMAIHDYDIHAGKNYFYYHNSLDDRWQVLNWDLDLCWTTTYNGGGGRGPLNQVVLDPNPVLQIEYRNRARELSDLLFNADQTGQILDEIAHVVYTPGRRSMVDADRAMWDYNPILTSGYVNSSKARHGRYYESHGTRTFGGVLLNQKNYTASRSTWLRDTQGRDTAIPRRPVATYVGSAGFPVDDLVFRSSSFSDPQGSGSFEAMKWRVAEITPAGEPKFDPLNPKIYEIDAVWESGEITTFQEETRIPSGALKVAHTYRARVRMLDNTGRWSRWSAEVEFVAGAPTQPFEQSEALRITEIMYHPLEGTDFEFIEIQNISGETVDLSDVSFTQGIKFDFASSAVTELAPDEFAVVVQNEIVFGNKYDAIDLNVAGEYSGQLSNNGEQIVFTVGGNSSILDFAYVDAWYPLTDGAGHSLNIVDAFSSPASWALADSWKESSDLFGSPGRADGGPAPGGRQRPGDSNQDGALDLSDGISLLLRLFGGDAGPLPCEGSLEEAGNLLVLDVNGDDGVDISDSIFLLNYLFLGGPGPVAGQNCVRVDGCPSTCSS